MRPFDFIGLSALAAMGIIVPVDAPVSQLNPLADGSVATRTDTAVTGTTEDSAHAPQNDPQGTIVPSNKVKRAN